MTFFSLWACTIRNHVEHFISVHAKEISGDCIAKRSAISANSNLNLHVLSRIPSAGPMYYYYYYYSTAKEEKKMACTIDVVPPKHSRVLEEIEFKKYVYIYLIETVLIHRVFNVFSSSVQTSLA